MDKEESVSVPGGQEPLASTLVDLQLEGEARGKSPGRLAQFYCWCSHQV